MSVYGIHKITKENVDVYSTDEISDNSSTSGHLLAIDDKLKVYVSRLTDTYNIISNGNTDIEYQFTEEEIRMFLEYVTSDSEYQWKNSHIIIIPQVTIASDSNSKNVIATINGEGIQPAIVTVGTNAFINIHLENTENNPATGVGVQFILIAVGWYLWKIQSILKVM